MFQPFRLGKRLPNYSPGSLTKYINGEENYQVRKIQNMNIKVVYGRAVDTIPLGKTFFDASPKCLLSWPPAFSISSPDLVLGLMAT